MGVHRHPALCSTLVLQMLTSGLLPSMGAPPQVQTATTRDHLTVFDTDGSGISLVMMLLCRKFSSFARSAESCQCWAIARTLFLPPCVLPLAALLLWEKQVRGCCWALCCSCWSPHSWLLQSDAAPGCGNICNCLGQCYWAGAQDWNLPLLMPAGSSGYPPFHWWRGVPGEAALSLSDWWCGVDLPAACSSRSPVASNQLLYLTSLCCTHLLLNASLPEENPREGVSPDSMLAHCAH